VLRLECGDDIEIFDAAGNTAIGQIVICDHEQIVAEISKLTRPSRVEVRITLAVAWPKGKRAAVMVEKCAELGVHRIMPVRYERSVVTKDNESEGLTRLRRIAVEAAKQCGRNDTVEILSELSLSEVLNQQQPDELGLILDRSSKIWLPDVFDAATLARLKGVMLFVGPEGGLSDNELSMLLSSKYRSVRVAENVLRIETAALAACAITHMCLNARHSSPD
jgi:16S rRNA (uracil1498-N3)-methyltransferase